MSTSVLTKNQKQKFTKAIDSKRTIEVTLRYDDECGNGHNSFSITGSIRNSSIRGFDKTETCGCIHNEIKKYFPEFSHLIKWHLMDSDSPMHYVANSIYFASDRDCHGLLKGESKQIKSGKTDLPWWELVAFDKDGKEISIYSLRGNKDSLEKPVLDYTFEYRPWCRIGEGKTPDLEAARRSAIWPDATLEDFTKEKLEARLPNLIAEFKITMENLGFVF